VWAWQGPNEPKVGTTEQRRALAAFCVRLNALMRDYRWRYLAGTFASGTTPVEPERDHELRELLPIFRLERVALHQYGAPNLYHEPLWNVLRHRQLATALRRVGLTTLPQMYLTEVGIDGGTLKEGQPGYRAGAGGWKDFCRDFSEYLTQLLWLERELQRDAYIITALVFLAGAWGQQWQSFELCRSEVEELFAALTAPQARPENEPARDVPTLVRKSRWWLEEALRAKEQGQTQRADEIVPGVIALLQRAESAL